MSLEKNKQLMRQLCFYTCVACGTRNASIEVHHVDPKENGGSDEIENLVALCPNCHREYQGNDSKRTRLKEMRVWWIDECRKKVASENQIVKEISERLAESVTTTGAKLEEIKSLLLLHEQRKIDGISTANSIPQAIMASGVNISSAAAFHTDETGAMCKSCFKPIPYSGETGAMFCPFCGKGLR